MTFSPNTTQGLATVIGSGGVAEIQAEIDAALAAANSVDRGDLVQDDAASYQIPITALRVWDAISTVLPATPATDDFGVVTGTFLTDAPVVQSEDLKTAGATDKKLAFEFTVPPEYVDGETLNIRIRGNMVTTVADTTATIDVQCVRAVAPTVDICATAAQDLNSLTVADFDFVLTPTNIVSGDKLIVVVTAAINDGAGGTAVIGQIDEIEMLVDIKG